jgi:membrane-associated protease RseP (regulator of RpoE activity)
MTDIDDRSRPRRRTEPLRVRTPEPTHAPPTHRPVPEPRSHTRRPTAVERSTSPTRVALLGALVVFAGVAGGWPLLLMIFALLGMIFLHELGHYLTAKWAGMKVTEFFLGFGPRIWSFQRGETEYGIKAIPAGAYVKIIGMNNLDEFDPADADRTYMSKPFWRRLSVAVAGSTMHFLLALVCLFVAFAAVGVPGGSLTDPEWVIRTAPVEGSPAAEAGFEAGDHLLTVDGRDVGSFDEFTDYVRARPGETIDLVFERGDETLEREVALADRHPETREEVGFFGVSWRLGDSTRAGVLDSVGRTFGTFGELTGQTFEGIGRILSPSGLSDLGSRVVNANDDGEGPVVAGEEGSRPGPSREEIEDDLGRPVSVLGLTRVGSDILGDDIGDFFALFALINMFIGIFNLLPLLPLDGGHVVIAVYEKIRSMRLGRPYHVDVVKLLPLTYAVVLVMVFLGVSTIYLDIADPIGG